MKIICKDTITRQPVTKLDGYEKAGILLNRDTALISAVYGCIEKNITCIPLDPSWPDERLHTILRNTKADAVITTAEHAGRIHATKVIPVESDTVVDFTEGYAQNEIAYIQHTSGSTGEPKGVEIQRKAFFRFIDGISEHIDFSPEKRIACLSAASFDIFYLESVIALKKGLTIVLGDEEEQRNPKRMARLIAENSVDMIQMTPAKMQMLLRYDRELLCLKNVKDILIGGEPFPPGMLRVLQEKTSAQIYNLYGPTEATVWTTVSNLTNKDKIDIGRPIKNTEVFIADEHLSLMPGGTAGEICIAGSCLARGYAGRDDLTAEKFVFLPQKPDTRIYRTGDLGRYLPDGNLEYIGRIDNQIKIRGYRIEPEEIEAHLNQIAGIQQSIVTTIAVNETDKILAAFYTGEGVPHEQDILDYLSLKLPSYMIPAVYKHVENFILYDNGKVDRKNVLNCIEKEDGPTVLREAALDGLTQRQKDILEAIQNNLQSEVAKRLYLDTNLSGIGVDSITFIRLVVALEDTFNLEFDDERLTTTEFSTIGSIIEYVDQKLDERT